MPDFESSGLPQYLRGSWEKARDIISKNGVTKINDGTNVVVSITNPHKPHIVNYVGSKVTCDCEGFQRETLCAHVIAGSHKENLLCNVVSSWKPSLSDLVSSSIPKKAGRKPGPQRYRPSPVAQETNVPPEPYNIVLCRKQIRAYTPKGTTDLRFTVKPKNTYFHLKKSWILKLKC